MDLRRFERKPLMGILRGIEPEELAPVLQAAEAGGLETLEITMNTPGAADLIARARALAPAEVAIGAGTVLGTDALHTALEAGAGFIVSPVCEPEVVRECVDRAVPVFPGAFTPQEVHTAWCAGASAVKVFPAGFLGPEYLRALKGPFDGVRLLACGGVSADSLGAYAECGADAFAFGESVFKRAWIEAGDHARIESAVRALVEALAASQAHRSETSLS